MLQGNDGDQHGRACGNERKIEPSRHNAKKYAKCGECMARTGEGRFDVTAERLSLKCQIRGGQRHDGSKDLPEENSIRG